MAARELEPADALAQLSFLIQANLAARASEQDVSLIQARLLGVLRDRTPTMNDLAKLLGLDKSSTSGLVDRAARRGLVARVPSSVDRRVVQVELTAAGRALATRVARRFQNDVEGMLDLLPSRERATLVSLVSKFLVTYASTHGVDLFDTVR